MNKRKEFEDAIRMNRVHLGNYVKYAKWEEAQQEFERSRSVFERALDVDHRSPSLWLKYAEMEMRNKFVNHARNVWDRATALLPRVDQFWYKYTYMEEMVENYAVCRSVFERWMAWEPDDKAWHAYVAFEERRRDSRRARQVLERFVACHPRLPSYLKYARWEERQSQIPNARQVYERALAELGEWEMDDGDEAKLYSAFARFEEHQREFARARAIYTYAARKLDRDAHPDLHEKFLRFEKKHGDVSDVERHVYETRRRTYEQALVERPRDYDAWFDLVRLEEGADDQESPNGGDHGAVRDAYERAVANVPPASEKKYWRRYVYLWLNYAAFEELVARDVPRARAVYRAALDVVPHARFTFGKLWLGAADLEVRARDVGAARKVLGEALGKCRKLAKPKLYAGYALLERQLGEVDRCRKIYAKWVEADAKSSKAWAAFGDLEHAVGEQARARAVYELALAQADVDKPEVLWKKYIDLEIYLEKHPDEDDDDDESNKATGFQGPSKAAALYERLLERTAHVKVFLSYATYEADLDGDGTRGDAQAAADRRVRARDVFARANDALKESAPEDRVAVLDAWAAFEQRACDDHGDDASHLAHVRSLFPRKVKKKRPRDDDPDVLEEYYDFVFPGDAKPNVNLKILEMAKKWKMANKRPRTTDDDDDNAAPAA